MEKPVFHRVLLKISGEALAGDKHSGLDFEVIGQVCDVIKKCLDMGVQVGLVVGGGNFWRGAKNSGGGKMERSRADHIGMLATVMNCLAVADVCEQKGIPVRVQTAIEMPCLAWRHRVDTSRCVDLFPDNILVSSGASDAVSCRRHAAVQRQ